MKMADDEFVDAVSYAERLNEALKTVDRLQQKLQRQQEHNHIMKPQRDLQTTQDKYQRISTEKWRAKCNIQSAREKWRDAEHVKLLNMLERS